MQLVVKESDTCTFSELKEITRVASESFGQELTLNFVLDVRSHVQTSKKVVLAYVNSVMTGFCLSSSLGDILYISGVCVSPALQGYGLGCSMLRETIFPKNNQTKFVILRTQNEAMKTSFEKTLKRKVFPNGKIPPQEILDAVNRVRKHLGDELSEVLITKGCYGKSLYGSHIVINNVGDLSQINTIMGDAVYCAIALD